MGISISCHCGKVMIAREQFAGRMVKCPQCGAVVQIPNVTLGGFSNASAEIEAERSPLRPEIIPFQPDAERSKAPVTRAIQAVAHSWEDHSLTQNPTPWLPGDEARFQKGVVAPPHGPSV